MNRLALGLSIPRSRDFLFGKAFFPISVFHFLLGIAFVPIEVFCQTWAFPEIRFLRMRFPAIPSLTIFQVSLPWTISIIYTSLLL